MILEVALGIVLAVLILKHLQVIFGLGVIAVAVAIVALVFGGAFIWLAGEWQQNGLRDVGGGIASIAVGAVVLAGVCGLFGLGAELESRTKIVDTTEFVFLAVAGVGVVVFGAIAALDLAIRPTGRPDVWTGLAISLMFFLPPAAKVWWRWRRLKHQQAGGS